MSMFALAISCMTSPNLPWFMVLTYQVPMQYCSLQHWALLSPPVTSTTGCHFCFGSGSSFLLELFPHSFSSSILGTYQTGFSSFHVISFFLFTLFMWFSRQECWGGLPFPSPVGHVLSEFSTMTPTIFRSPYMACLIVSLSYTKLWSMWSFWLVLCDYGFHSVCPLMDEDKGFVQASWREGLAVGKTRSALIGRVMLSKSLIQFLLINGAVLS